MDKLLEAGIIQENGNINLESIDKKDRKEVEEYITNVYTAMSSRAWRMRNLYKVDFKKNAGAIDEEEDFESGQIVTFKINSAQQVLEDNTHPRVLVPKSRQRGITTYKCIDQLDRCLFAPPDKPFRAGIIFDTQKNAIGKFKQKIKDVYERLPKFVKYSVYPLINSSMHIQFNNGSYIKVGTSHIGDTLDDLHLSEFGKICEKTPDKADEIVQEAFPTVGTGQSITIESTGRGKGGYFHTYCMKADEKQKLGAMLSPLDWKMFFFAWWQDPSCILDPTHVIINKEMAEYFEKIEALCQITLTPEQKAWYATTKDIQKDKMRYEYPSTLEECFEEDLEGAYYSKQFTQIRKERRICTVPFLRGSLVYTGWDLGVSDFTAIWFAQIAGREIHLIDYYENHDEQMGHYAWVLKEKENTLGYKYEEHIAPHDINVRDFSAEGDRIEMARKQHNVKFFRVVRGGLAEGIEITRQMLSQCVFDEANTGKGYRQLESYRKKYNEQLGKYEDIPVRGNEIHCADAFRTLMVRLHERLYGGRNKQYQGIMSDIKKKWKGYT